MKFVTNFTWNVRSQLEPDWLILYYFASHSRIFHLHRDVPRHHCKFNTTMAFDRFLRLLSREGSLSCHTCCDTWPRYTRSHPKVRPASRLLRQARGTEDISVWISSLIFICEVMEIPYFCLSRDCLFLIFGLRYQDHILCSQEKQQPPAQMLQRLRAQQPTWRHQQRYQLQTTPPPQLKQPPKTQLMQQWPTRQV